MIVGSGNLIALYGQVGLWSADASEYPALTGRLVASSDSAIAVAVTSGPSQPPARVEVWVGDPPHDQAIRAIWRGILAVRGGVLFGDWVGGQTYFVEMADGVHRVEAHSSLTSSPALVRFVMRSG
jgi:hypothetical protein